MDDSKQTSSKPGPWHPVTWAFIGFFVGTSLAAPFILSADRRDRTLGGMVYGGIPGVVLGLAYGMGRRNKSPVD
jgi:hypothetical protein